METEVITESKYLPMLQYIEAEVDVKMFKDIPEFERIHLKAIHDHIHALIAGKEFLFNCLDCKFKSNSGKQAAIHRNKNSHKITSIASGWFCICGSTGTNPITMNKHMKYYCRAFRFNEDTLKPGEASNIAFNFVKSLNFEEKYKFSIKFKQHLNEMHLKGVEI